MKKVALIVGASSGIGMHTAKLFAEKGYTVVNMARRNCEIENVISIQLDVTDATSMERAWEQFTLLYNRLDIFIYSAGFSMACPLEYVKESDYRYLFEVNFFGYLHLLKKCLPYLKKSNGVSCIVGSIGGVAPIPYDCYYSASKAAVNMLVMSLQYEFLPQGVKVLCVMPGGTKTHFTFKRKEYDLSEVREYKKDQERAARALEEIEQGGMKASKVAKTIYNRCTKISTANLYASGIKNKLTSFLIRIIPQRMLYLFIRSQFELNGK
ncbi:MAG: SDR family NAD(P)-dependent oxidoreductase [Clostridiales bacterium]|nr:SDR family NAD(P)-dependent oxidoreductase [Clostridiales bacterium]